MFLGENERGKVPFRHIPPSARADDTNMPWHSAGPGPGGGSAVVLPLPASRGSVCGRKSLRGAHA